MIKNKIANASLISFFTVSNKTYEEVFFILRKELQEIAPSNKYWYKYKGQNGESSYISEKAEVKQWLVIAEDSIIEQIWEDIKNDQLVIQEFINDSKKINVKFKILSTIESISVSTNKINIELEDNEDLYSLKNYNLIFLDPKFGFMQEEINFKEFEKTDKELQFLIFPPGLLRKNELFNLIKNKIYVKNIRRTFFDLKGSYKDNHKNLSGFIQLEKPVRKDMEIHINDENNLLIAQTKVDPASGVWKIILEKELWEGNYSVVKDGETIFRNEFKLLKDISVNVNVQDKIIKDLYGRELSIETINDQPTRKNITWYKDLFINDLNSEIQLSDEIAEILFNLRPKIYIIDPYVFGNINFEKGEIVFETISQKIFFNALIKLLSFTKIDSINFIGDKRRFEKFFGIKYDNIIILYKQLFQKLNFGNINEINLLLTSSFHDRYWISDPESNSVTIFKISNSINGMFESKEINVSLTEETNKAKTLITIKKRIENSEKIKIL